MNTWLPSGTVRYVFRENKRRTLGCYQVAGVDALSKHHLATRVPGQYDCSAIPDRTTADTWTSTRNCQARIEYTVLSIAIKGKHEQ